MSLAPDRQKFVGASEVGALLGISPWKSRYELYLEKTGEKQPPNLDDKIPVFVGSALEPVIAEYWAKKRGVIDLKRADEYLRDPEIQLGASLDYIVDQKEAWEIKAVSERSHASWPPENPPLYYALQLQVQLGLAGFDSGRIVALVGNSQIVEYKMAFRPKIFEHIRNEAAEFWEEVNARRPPMPDFSQDGDTLARMMWKENKVANVKDADPATGMLLEEYMLNKRKRDALDREVRHAKAEILHKMNSEGLTGILHKLPTGETIRASLSSISEVTVPATTRAAHVRLMVSARKPKAKKN